METHFRNHLANRIVSTWEKAVPCIIGRSMVLLLPHLQRLLQPSLIQSRSRLAQTERGIRFEVLLGQQRLISLEKDGLTASSSTTHTP